MTDEQDGRVTEPTIDPVGETVPGAEACDAEASGGESASDLYDADRPPFEERPEKPKAPPAAPVAPQAGRLSSREVQVRAGAAAGVVLLGVLLLRHRRRPDHISRRARRATGRRELSR